MSFESAAALILSVLLLVYLVYALVRAEKVKDVKIVAGSGLTEEEVARLVAEAETTKDADATRRELAEMRNNAEALLYTTETSLKEYAELLTEDVRTQLSANTATLRAAVDSGADLATLRAAYAALEASAYQMTESLYGSTG